MFCHHYGKEIEDHARLCQHCGTPINEATSYLPKVSHDGCQPSGNKETQESSVPNKVVEGNVKKRHPIRTVLYVILALILIPAGFLQIKNMMDPYSNILGIEDMRKAYSYAKAVITEELTTPKSAEFPDFSPDYVSQRSEELEHEGLIFNVYTVSAYVDADNAFGTPIRGNFTVKIGLPEDKDSTQYYYEITAFD